MALRRLLAVVVTAALVLSGLTTQVLGALPEGSHQAPSVVCKAGDPADIALTITDSSDPAILDQVFTLEFRVTNAGCANADDVTLSADLNTAVTRTGATGDGVNDTICILPGGTGGTCQTKFFTLTPGQSKAITYSLRPHRAVVLNFSGSATTSSSECTTLTTQVCFTTNNSDTETTGVDPVVNTTTDTDDGQCTAAVSGIQATHCSLREAINAANAIAGANSIFFNISGPPFSIKPTSSLPGLAGQITIDGTTQPGYAGTPIVEVDGINAGSQTSGLMIGCCNSTVRGLAINRFSRFGIELTGGANLVVGNFVGINVSGNAAAGNGTAGTIFGGIGVFSSNNTIGGTTAASRNVISGNIGAGIWIENNPSGNVIAGNFIGTDASGAAAVANGSGLSGAASVFAAGVAVGGNNNTVGPGNVVSGNVGPGVLVPANDPFIDNVIKGNLIGTNASGIGAIANGGDGIRLANPKNRIGGTASGDRNVISGNSGSGIHITGTAATGAIIEGNYIGTNAAGSAPLGNVGNGISISDSPSNTIGGATAAAGNLIANNGGAGVAVSDTPLIGSAIRNAILGNSIFSNARLGIDLEAAGDPASGVTPNDLGDTDTGPNNLQNFPVITSAVTSGTTTTIQWTLNSTPNTTFTIEFFNNLSSSPACDASGFGEGQTFIASTIQATTDSSGNASGSVSVPSLQASTVVTATATDPSGNTSEFSACQQVTQPMQAFFNNLAGFNTAAGSPPIRFAFDLIRPDADITGHRISIVTFQKGDQPAPSAPLVVVRGSDTFTPAGFTGVVDANTNKLFATSGQNVLSPGGRELAPGPNAAKENDDLALTFDPPVAAVGFDLLFQSKDCCSFVGMTVFDAAGSVLFQQDPIPTSATGTGGDPSGALFVGFVSGQSNIAKIVINEYDENNGFPDSNIGFDTFRLFAPIVTFTPDAVVPGGTLTVSVNGFAASATSAAIALVDPTGHNLVASLGTLSLTSGSGSGSFAVPNTVALGDYKIRASSNPVSTVSEAALSVVGPKTFVVNTTNDVDDGACDATHCSLREAIKASNANPARDTIAFNITSPFIISLASALPTITDPVSLDGTTQPGFTGTPLIVLNGANAGTAGLTITAGNTTVRGLVIRNFSGPGIHLLTNVTNGGNLVAGNFIGTNETGTAAAGNQTGILVERLGTTLGSLGHTIGGAAAADRNVISGNSLHGVHIRGGASGILVQGNRIGTNAAGTAAIGNGFDGVVIESSPDNGVFGNLISGNGEHGIRIEGAASSGNNLIGNIIGPDVTGSLDLTTGLAGTAGVFVLNAPQTSIGEASAAERNVISGNQHGVSIVGSGAFGNRVRGNYIGTNAAGTAALGNTVDGVLIENAPDTLVGGTCVGCSAPAGNVVSGNGRHGINVAGAGSLRSAIFGNLVGTNAQGTGALGNAQEGISLNGSPSNTTIGAVAAGNLIAHNGGQGIAVVSGSTGTTVQNNSLKNNVINGLFLGANGALVANNEIRDNGTGIGLASDSSTIRDNTISGNLNVGVNGSGSNNTFTNNIVDANRNGGFFMGFPNSTTRNNVFTGNTVRNNGGRGFLFRGPAGDPGAGIAADPTQVTDHNEINAGSITNNALEGIRLAFGANDGIEPPTITSIQGNGSTRLVVRGTARPGARVQIYSDPVDEGATFLGETTAAQDGTWQKSDWGLVTDMQALQTALRTGALVVRATQTNPGNTSQFSGTVAFQGLLTGIAQCNGTVQPGATVELLSGSTVVGTTTAGPDGSYAFSGLAPNTTYSVRYTAAGALTPCGGQTITTDGDGGGGVPPPDAFQDPGNTNWIKAFPLGSSASHPITAVGQSRWYKKSVQPGQQIRVFLENVATVGVNLQLALYDDLVQVAQRLQAEATAASTQATPFDSIPFDSIPFDSIPFDSIPFDSIPFDSIPFDSIPFDSIPFDSIPFDSIPFDSIPFDSIPFDSIPFDSIGVTPTSYTTAQRAGILAVSARPGLSNELIVRNVGDRTGNFYIQVWADNGALPPALKFFTITAVTVGGCTIPGTDTPATLVRPQAGWASALQPASTPRVLILWNPARTRMDDGTLLTASANAASLSAVQSRLNQLAAESGGVVVDLGAIAGLQQFYAQFDQLSTCIAAANILAEAIRDVILAQRAPNPSALQYLVLVGSDLAEPYHRNKDQSGFATEQNFNPPVGDLTSSRASLVQDFVLEQDFYVSFRPLQLRGDLFPLPDIAVGRLAETAEDIVAALDAYFAAPLDTTTGNRVVTPPTGARGLFTGYTFLSDFATALADRFQGYGLTTDRLIQPANLPATDPSAWSATEVSNLLFAASPSPSPYSVIGLIAHFNAFEALAADYRSVLRSTQVLGVTDSRFLNSLVLSPGCHSGYNVVNPHGIPGVTEARDWTQAWTRRGATTITQTGYGYGDTEVIGATEQLLIDVAQELGFNPAAVPIGWALRNAKHTYVGRLVDITGLDEKVVKESTLYGVPMLSWNFTGGRTPRPVTGSEATPSPADANGLSTADLTPAATIQQVNRTLDVIGTTTTVTESYFTANGDVQTIPFHPILPRRAANASAAGRLARGAVLLSADYVDIAGFTPLVDVPATELPTPHPTFVTSVFWPPRPFAINPLSQTLVTTPFGYLSDGLTPTGTARVFATQTQPAPNFVGTQATSFRIYYSNRSDVVASMAGPPSILRTLVTAQGTKVKVEVTVAGAAAAPLEDVLVTYTGRSTSPQNTLYGRWRSCSLVPGRTNTPGTTGPARTASCADAVETTVSSTATAFVKRFSATVVDTANVDTANTGAAVTDVLLFIQAVNVFAEVAFDANDGAYFRFVPQAATAQQPKTPTTLTLQVVPATATYGSSIQLSATLTGAPAGSIVTFGFGNTQVRRTTVTTNVASVTVASVTIGVNEVPGTYTASVTFDEDEFRLGSSASASTAVQRAATTYQPLDTLLDTPQLDTLQYSDRARILELRSGARVVNEQANFIQRPNGTTFTRLSDGAGGIFVDTIGDGLGAGSITVRYDGDHRYFGTQTSYTILPENATVELLSGPQPTGTVTLLAQVTQESDGMPGDLTRAVLHYVLTPESGTPITATASVNADGSSSTTVTLAPGVYSATITIGGDYTGAGTGVQVAFDPDVFMTGGGTVLTTAVADPTPTTPLPTGLKANFGFNAKYQQGSTTPHGSLLFQLQEANITFKSTSLEWLVISGSRGELQGRGTINGAGDFGFRLIAQDLASGDTFEIRIWDASGSFDQPKYRIANTLNRGSIIVH